MLLIIVIEKRYYLILKSSLMGKSKMTGCDCRKPAYLVVTDAKQRLVNP